MTPGEVVLALVRRWYVLLFALLLTAVGAYHVTHPREQYLSTAVVVVKPPVTGNQPNQFTNLQPPLAAVSYAIVQQLQSPAGTSELRAAGVAPGTWTLVPRNSGTSVTPAYLIPSLQVQVRYGDATAADTMVGRIVSVYSAHLEKLQTAQHIPADAMMSADLLVPPGAVPVVGAKTRALAGVAILGAVGGVLAALWTDRLLAAHRRGGLRGGRAAAPRTAPAVH
jgi:hypothetical protein